MVAARLPSTKEISTAVFLHVFIHVHVQCIYVYMCSTAGLVLYVWKKKC